ncbi:MAG TPA: hypothetical protein VFW48_02265 [Solirubrobacterales bacterium]|nr:hypothetical protein [Solirubrobacterales bacterium]
MVAVSVQDSLYAALAVAAPPSAPKGETISTKAKETIDNDVEAITVDELVHGVC